MFTVNHTDDAHDDVSRRSSQLLFHIVESQHVTNQSSFSVCARRLYQHKVEKCSVPFDEVAGALSLTHTHTNTHSLACP